MSKPVIARSIAELDAIPTMPSLPEAEVEQINAQLEALRANFERQAAANEADLELLADLASDKAMSQLFELGPYLEQLLEAHGEDLESLPSAFEQLVLSMIELTDQALEIYTGGSESLRLKRSRLRLIALRARLVTRERRHEPRARLVAIAKPSRHEALVGLEAHAPPPLRALATSTYEGAA